MRPEIRDGKLRRERERERGERVVVVVIGTYRLCGRYVRGRFLFPGFVARFTGFPRSVGNELDGKIKSRRSCNPFATNARNPRVTRYQPGTGGDERSFSQPLDHIFVNPFSPFLSSFPSFLLRLSLSLSLSVVRNFRHSIAFRIARF